MEGKKVEVSEEAYDASKYTYTGVNVKPGDYYVKFEYDKKKPNSNKNLAIKKVSEDS